MTVTRPPSLQAIVFQQGLFLFSGLFQTMGTQYLYYQGAATGISLLTNTASYIGMALVGLFLIPCQWCTLTAIDKVVMDGTANTEIDLISIRSASKKMDDYRLVPDHIPEENDEDVIADQITVVDCSIPKSSGEPLIKHKKVIGASILDVSASFLLTIGFFYIGSGMYQVIYSSVVVWCAVLSFVFLRRSLSLVQWVCIIGVSFGLAISALGIEQSDEIKAPPPTISGSGPALLHSFTISTTMFGMILTCVATFGYACVYVVSDMILSTKDSNNNPPSPVTTCFLVGCYGSFICLIYLTIYTFPHWDSLVTNEIIEKKSDIGGKSTGNVSTGLLNSVRAVVVFAMSHFLFCDIDSGQCFNIWKGWSAVIVIGCVTVFSISKTRKQ